MTLGQQRSVPIGTRATQRPVYLTLDNLAFLSQPAMP